MTETQFVVAILAIAVLCSAPWVWRAWKVSRG